MSRIYKVWVVYEQAGCYFAGQTRVWPFELEDLKTDMRIEQGNTDAPRKFHKGIIQWNQHPDMPKTEFMDVQLFFRNLMPVFYEEFIKSLEAKEKLARIEST